jgi:hypothetical protein
MQRSFCSEDLGSIANNAGGMIVQTSAAFHLKRLDKAVLMPYGETATSVREELGVTREASQALLNATHRYSSQHAVI